MKMIASLVLAAAALAASGDEMKTLSAEDRALLAKKYDTLTPAEKAKRQELVAIRALIDDGGDMVFPGTPRGTILIANLQKRVPTERLAKLRESFTSMLAYDVRFSDADAKAEIAVRIVDRPDVKRALTVWPDEGQAEVNVAALAADDPKPAFLAARVRKEVIRAFSCATAGSTYESPLFGCVRSAKDLDKIVGEDFPLDVMMRSSSYLKGAGLTQIRRSTYREVVESGYDVAPTNAYQKAIYDEVKKTVKLTKKLP